MRAYKTELDPDNAQRTAMLEHAGTARFTYNWGLARRKEEYEKTGTSSNAIELHKQLNALKKAEFPWMYEVSKCAPQEALRDLNAAMNLASVAASWAETQNACKSGEVHASNGRCSTMKQEPNAVWDNVLNG